MSGCLYRAAIQTLAGAPIGKRHYLGPFRAKAPDGRSDPSGALLRP